MRKRRCFKSLRLYELCFRTRSGLPFPARRLTKILIESAIARTQRDNKVLLCGYLWMANHAHMLVFSQDITDLKRFYEEIKKRLTESVKRLLGLHHLQLWEDVTMVAEVLDLAAAIKRFGYMYSNPASAHLVNSVSEYPGANSWKEFVECKPEIDGFAERVIPWVHMTAIPFISEPKIFSESEEALAITKILANSQEVETLKIYPFAFLRAFKISAATEIEDVKNSIIAVVNERQKELILQRAIKKIPCLGISGLAKEPLLRSFQPIKHERRILFISSLKKLRLDFLEAYCRFVDECRHCYDAWKNGNFAIDWPIGAFKPPPPILINPIS